MTSTTVTREQILSFRLQRQNLRLRLAADSLEEAAGVCGIQNSPPGAALLGLHARVEAISRAALDQALRVDKRLVQLWSVRAAPLLVPIDKAAPFTVGLLPRGEEEHRFLIKGASEHLARLGVTAVELVAAVGGAIPEALDGRELTKDDLGRELSLRLAGTLASNQLDLWNSPDQWGHFGESLVRFALNVVSLQGIFCVISHEDGPATFVRTDQWLGQPFAQMKPETAAAELLRHYLGAYGPSTMRHFSEWAGVAPAQSERIWRELAAELTCVKMGSKTLWMYAADLSGLQDSTLPQGVRMLPPHDPYLAARDRTMLVPDKRLHTQIWRAVGSPGVVLLNGEIAGTWRVQKRGSKLRVEVTEFDRPQPARAALEDEIACVARLRGCERVDIIYT
jgi:hypothetical protein